MLWGQDWGEGWGGPPPEIDSHAEDAVDRLIDQFQKPNIEAAMEIVGDRAQKIEDVLKEFPYLFDINTNYGVWQDIIGSLLDQPRNAQTDEDYRRFLITKSQHIKKRRTVEDLLAVARALVGDDTRQITFTDTYPKAYKIEIENLTEDEIIAFLPFMRRSKPATYIGKFIVIVTDAFGHSDASGSLPAPPPPFGFGDASGALPTAGGPLSYIVPF